MDVYIYWFTISSFSSFCICNVSVLVMCTLQWWPCARQKFSISLQLFFFHLIRCSSIVDNFLYILCLFRMWVVTALYIFLSFVALSSFYPLSIPLTLCLFRMWAVMALSIFLSCSSKQCLPTVHPTNIVSLLDVSGHSSLHLPRQHLSSIHPSQFHIPFIQACSFGYLLFLIAFTMTC